MSSRRSRRGGSLDRHHLEPMIKILAELALGDGLFQIAVGRRNQAHVDLDRLVAADAEHFPVLQHAQQLRLQGQRHVADLVEEQRAAVGVLETALAHLVGRR